MKRAFQSLILITCLATTVQAEAIRQPPSLEAGDQYRLAFVTSTKTPAVSTDIEFYNNFVQGVADAAPLGAWGLEWKAIGSTETVSARENTSTDTDDVSVPVFTLDGAELVPSYSILWNGEVEVTFRHFDVNELGIAFNSPDPPILSVWTGTGADGFPVILPDDLGDVKGGPLGLDTHSIVGSGDSDSHSWMNLTAIPNKLEAPMYAISEVLTAVPEPSNSTYWIVLLTSLATLRRRKYPRFAP